MSEFKLARKQIVVGPLQCNCQVIWDPASRDAIVIDPGADPHKILKLIKDENLKLRYAIHTHAHFDHCGATGDVKAAHAQAKVALHKGDEQIYQALPMQGQMFGFEYEAPPSVDHFVQDDEEIVLGGSKLKVIHTPGHSPGGVCLHFAEGLLLDVPVLFSGDTLFQRSIGRTDLWGADHGTLIRKIKDRLLTLEDDTKVFPGHGPTTSIALEARENPFL